MEHDLITRVEQILVREDGTQVRIVAQEFDGLFRSSVGVDVFRRPHEGANWTLCSDRPHPDWRTMSVAEYNARGRCEKFQAASHGEIFRVSGLVGLTRQQARERGAVCV